MDKRYNIAVFQPGRSDASAASSGLAIDQATIAVFGFLPFPSLEGAEMLVELAPSQVTLKSGNTLTVDIDA